MMIRLHVTSPDDYLEFNDAWIVYGEYKCPIHQARLIDSSTDGAFTVAESGREYNLVDLKTGQTFCTIPVTAYNINEFIQLSDLLQR